MEARSVTLPSFRTGRVETPQAVRNSLAFDLRVVACHDITAAELQLPDRLARHCDRARLSASGTDAAYGDAAGASPLRLNDTALADLCAAAGAFFTLDAVLEDASGQPLRVSALPGDVFTLVVSHMTSASAMRHAAA